MKKGNVLKYCFTAAIILTVLLLVSCSGDKKDWLEKLSAVERREFESGDIPEEKIENLKKGISYYEKEVKRTVKASTQIGVYYRMLTLEYMSLEMYAEAFKSVEKAVEYFPTSPTLYYYGAVSAAQMTVSLFDENLSGEYLDKAEKYYLRAVKLDPNYNEALYGLSVLYIFELNRPLEAEKYLDHLVERSRTNYDAMFLLARVKILRGEIDEAVELYSVIEEKSPDDEAKQKAKDNRMRLVGGYANG